MHGENPGGPDRPDLRIMGGVGIFCENVKPIRQLSHMGHPHRTQRQGADLRHAALPEGDRFCEEVCPRQRLQDLARAGALQRQDRVGEVTSVTAHTLSARLCRRSHAVVVDCSTSPVIKMYSGGPVRMIVRSEMMPP